MEPSYTHHIASMAAYRRALRKSGLPRLTAATVASATVSDHWESASADTLLRSTATARGLRVGVILEGKHAGVPKVLVRFSVHIHIH